MTLIEVLITIVVFTSGILVILSVITNSLSLWSRSRNQTIATMLAKEWIEMMYNLRDTNLDKAQQRWCVRVGNNTNCETSLLSDAQTYYINIDNTWSSLNPITIRWFNTDKAAINTRLYMFTWWGITVYNHNQAGIPSQFYRYITVSPTTGIPWTKSTIDSNLKKITSTVEYSQLWWTGKVELESFIGLTR